MPKPGPIGDLAAISSISGTAQDGPEDFRGFVTVRAEDAAGGVLLGQITPAEARRLGLRFLATAEAAEQDAIVFTILVRDVELPAEVAATVVGKMRDERPDEDGTE